MMKIMALSIMIVVILFMVSFLMKDHKKSQNEKKNIFECGFDPAHEKRNSFSLRFFLITIIFLLFDLEITFIFPLPLQMKNSMFMNTLLIHTFILFFFITSTYLEWKQGAFNWIWFNI